MMGWVSRWLIIWILFAYIPVFAQQTRSRYSIGLYSSYEFYPTKDQRMTTNNFARLSGRYYLLHQADLKQALPYQFTVDVRDKYSFFDKLNSKARQLEDTNYLQIHRLFLSLPSKDYGLKVNLGRFNSDMADGVTSDGLSVTKKIGSQLLGSFWLGGDPQADADPQTLRYDPRQQNYGVGLHYTPFTLYSPQSLFLTNALIIHKRTTSPSWSYLRHSIVFQNQGQYHLFATCKTIITPQVDLPFLLMRWTGYWMKTNTSSLQFLHNEPSYIELPTESLDDLPISAYQELSHSSKIKLLCCNYFQLQTSFGIRKLDQLKNLQLKLGYIVPKLVDPYNEGYFLTGYRHRFNRSGPFLRMGTNYYSLKWEADLHVDIAHEKTPDQIFNPVSVGLQTVYFFSAHWMITFYAAIVSDKTITVTNFWSFLTYQFATSSFINRRYMKVQP